MDAGQNHVRKSVGFDCVQEHVTSVYNYILAKHRDDAEAFLRDPNVEAAIMEIDPLGKTRDEIAGLKRQKEEAVEMLKRR